MNISLYRTSRAFTLVELMIVIAIIGILAAALFPQMTQYMARSRDTTLMTEAKRFQNGLDLYSNDVGRYPNIADYPTTTEVQLKSLANILVPQYITSIPGGIARDRHAYASNSGGTFYVVLLYTETMYASSVNPTRGHTCIFGIDTDKKPLLYGQAGYFSDGTGVFPSICDFQ